MVVINCMKTQSTFHLVETFTHLKQTHNSFRLYINMVAIAILRMYIEHVILKKDLTTLSWFNASEAFI